MLEYTTATMREHIGRNLAIYGLLFITAIVLLVYSLIPEYEMAEIDGCTYIKYRRYNQSGITHCGTCPNPIHRAKEPQ